MTRVRLFTITDSEADGYSYDCMDDNISTQPYNRDEIKSILKKIIDEKLIDLTEEKEEAEALNVEFSAEKELSETAEVYLSIEADTITDEDLIKELMEYRDNYRIYSFCVNINDNDLVL